MSVEAEVRERALPVAERMAEDLVAQTIAIAAVPAPPYGEAERGAFLLKRFREVGLADVHQDEMGNVIGLRAGAGGGPRILLAAHMDTVFPAGTDVTPRREGGRVHGPGIRDNSAGVGVLLGMVQALDAAGIQTPGELVVCSNVGEEGLGNLRGMRALMEAWGSRVDAVLVVDGDLSGVIHAGIGSTRLRLRITTPGGHSYGNFGQPNAIHIMGRIIADFSAVRVPERPRTTYNVGTIAGGISVNSIAASCEAVIDMRSVEVGPLDAVEAALREIVARHAKGADVRADIEVLGRRPVGSIPADHPLVKLVAEAHRAVGLPVRSEASSTDANIPLAMGIPAVCTGASQGGAVHSPTEYLDADSLVPGVKSLLMAVALVQDRFPPSKS
jgi:tripeptide aminopeptidase